MKKVTLLFAAIAVAFSVQAQSVGLKAGATFANWNGDEAIDEMKSKAGLVFGVFADLNLGDGGFAIHTGIDYQQKGFKVDEDGYKETNTLNYLVIPVRAAYNIDAGPVVIFVEAGPYLGLGLSGKSKFEIEGIGEDEADLDFGSADDEISGTDFGLSFGGGVKVSKLRAALNYDLGLSSLSNVEETDIKNGVFMITLGYAIF